MDKKIHVPISADLKPLIPNYLESRQKDMVTFEKALSEADFETIRKLSHKIKGHGASYGFKELSTLASQIEEAAKIKEAEVIQQSLKELSQYLDSIEVIYY